MSRKRRPRVMVNFFPLSRLRKLDGEGTPPHWRSVRETTALAREHLCLEYERRDGTGDYGGIHVEYVSGGRGPDKDLPLLAASRNALPHFIAVVETALALESVLQGDPAICDLSRALDIFRERGAKRGGLASRKRSDMNADDPSVTREVIGGGR